MTVVAEPELLELHESATTAGPIRSDGLVPLHIIRPGIGKGKGRHLYEADMLQREVAAGRFAGWKMYLDHLDPVAKKRSAGLPRSIRDLAGQVNEAWWDGSVAADPKAGHGQGAVVGLAKVNRFMRSLIEDLPEAVGASISATATGVRPVNRGGQQVWLVEGINPRGSVDFVTEAGAGGRVVSLLEALEESLADDQEVFEVLEGKSDREVIELLESEFADRPGLRRELLAAMDDGDAEDKADGGSDERAELIAKYMKKFRGNRKMAEKAADRELAGAKESFNEGGDDVTIEDLQEALETGEGRALLESVVAPLVDERFASIVAPRLAELFESALEDERELIQAEADATAGRRLQLRDLRDTAHRVIAESELPAPFKAELRGKYDLAEDGRPTPALDVTDDEPGDGAKSAAQKITEAVNDDLSVKEEQFRASRPPTRVRGQGPRRDVAETKNDKDGDDEGTKVEESRAKFGEKTSYVLQEAGVAVDDDLYSGILD